MKLKLKKARSIKENKKVRMAEPSGDVTNLNDKGYKKLFKNKEMFLEFLQSFVHEDWVNKIDSTDMILIDKELILEGYRKKEADIIYKLNLKDDKTGEVKNVIFYLLLELQSSVDRLMPYRLLMYMVQIWRELLTNIKHTDTQKSEFRLPAIVPIVMHNGWGKWDMSSNFKDMLNEAEMFGDHLIDFKYILVNVNSYSKDELIKLANTISVIVMLDQKIVSQDKEELQNRLNKIVELKDKISPEKLNLIFEWVQEVFSKRFNEKTKEDIVDVIKVLKGGENLTYAIEKLIDNIKNEGKNEVLSKSRQILAKQLKIKLNLENIPDLYLEKINNASVETIEEISVNIFSIDSIEDLAKFLE